MSVFLEKGDPLAVKDNVFLEGLFPESWKSGNVGESAVLTEKVNINQIQYLGKSENLNKAFYKYEGSLTTPPCSEGVTHFVLKTPVKI